MAPPGKTVPGSRKSLLAPFFGRSVACIDSAGRSRFHERRAAAKWGSGYSDGLVAASGPHPRAQQVGGTSCRESLLDVLHLLAEIGLQAAWMLGLQDSDRRLVHAWVHRNRAVGCCRQNATQWGGRGWHRARHFM